MGWRIYIPHALFFGGIVGAVLAAFCVPKTRRRAYREGRARVAKAREAILADGKVEGPKGDYVPHKRWETGTPHATKPIKARSYDGGPWPE
jgi:hypothetical protein